MGLCMPTQTELNAVKVMNFGPHPGHTLAAARRAHAGGAAEVSYVERECAGPVVDGHRDDVNAKVAGRLRFELGVAPGPGPHPVVTNGDGHCGLPGGHVPQQRGSKLEHLGVEAVRGVLEQPSSVHDVVVHVPVLVPMHIKDSSTIRTNELDLSPKHPPKGKSKKGPKRVANRKPQCRSDLGSTWTYGMLAETTPSQAAAWASLARGWRTASAMLIIGSNVIGGIRRFPSEPGRRTPSFA